MLWVLIAAAGLFAMLFGVQAVDLDYDRQVRGHKVVLTLDAEYQGFPIRGEFGAVFEDSGRVRPAFGLKVDLTPVSSPSPFRLETLPQLRFGLLRPEGLRVRVGQFIRVGDLAAVQDPQEYARILRALEQATADGDSRLVEELERRKEAQEVRSLLAGEVVYIGLVQDGPGLRVVVYLAPLLPPPPSAPAPEEGGTP